MKLIRFCQLLGITEDQGRKIIGRANDVVELCYILSKEYGMELTIKEGEELWRTGI